MRPNCLILLLSGLSFQGGLIFNLERLAAVLLRVERFMDRLNVGEKVSFMDKLTDLTVSVAQGRRVPPCGKLL